MSQLTRQQLYNKIKETSKDEFILSEMKRLGFWTETDKPSLSQNLIQRRGEIEREIHKLSLQLSDPKAALKAIHQKRMADARQKRLDTKVKREVKRYQNALAQHQKNQTQITYLGDAAPLLSANKATPSDEALLQTLNLPNMSNAAQMAAHMGISLNELRFLTYSNQVAKHSHYQRFYMPKKSGGTRLISAPMPRLKRLQYWVLDNILQKLPLTDEAHGFVPTRSIVTNAKPHLAQPIVINMDLQDFFPSVNYPRIKGVFSQLGYNDEVAALLALLCSEADCQQVEMDGQAYYVNQSTRRLPQGAPTSPALSNLICRRLDKRLQGLASKHGFTYTRYADDLTFSGANNQAVRALLYWCKATVMEEGFTLHPEKTRIMKQGNRQEVTGIVVNQQLSLDRRVLKQFRALLFQIEKDGYAGKHWGSSDNLALSIKSFAHYVAMVNPEKGEIFLQQIARIQAKYPTPYKRHKISNNQFRQRSAQGLLPLPQQAVATSPAMPELDDLIEHKDVLEAVRRALGLDKPIVETAKEKTGDAPSPKPVSEPSGAKSNNLISTLLSFLRGQS